MAAHGYNCYDLSMLLLPSIDRGYLAEVRAAFEGSKVEIFQLLIDTGEVGSPDPDERQAGIEHTKFFIEVAAAVRGEWRALCTRRQPGHILKTCRPPPPPSASSTTLPNLMG